MPPPITPGFFGRFLFRLLLRTSRGQQWHRKLTAPGNLLGAPGNEEKIWHEFKSRIGEFAEHFAKLLWLRARNAEAHFRLRAAAPVKPHKKFLITLVNLPLSVEAAERCIESAKRYGENGRLEIMPAIDQFKSQDFFTRHGLTWNSQVSTNQPAPAMGCFASHFKLWLRCIELGEPIIALEHDAVFRAPIPTLKFRHVIMLGKPLFQGESLIDAANPPRGRETHHPWRYLLGTHCYAITPEGAHRLVEAARRRLLLPTDHFMHKKYIDILYYHPYPVDLKPGFTSIANTLPDGPGQEEVWKTYKPAPRDQ